MQPDWENQTPAAVRASGTRELALRLFAAGSSMPSTAFADMGAGVLHDTVRGCGVPACITVRVSAV